MKQKYIYLILLILLFLIPLIDLLHPGLPVTNDGKDHVARIANFYTNLQQVVLIPRWAANLNWGYGHPILEFLYPLPSYIASIFHFLGFSFIDSTKIVFGIGMLFSGICMYFWLAEFLPLPAAFVGGLLYVFTPYHFVELYVRGDIGENLAFVFMPLTLLFIYKIYKNYNNYKYYIVLASISLACLILSHNAISLMYLPFIIFYCIYVSYTSRDRFYQLRATSYLLLLGFGLSAFFWLPGLFEGKYTLRNILTAGDYKNRFITFNSLVYSPWNYDVAGRFTKQLGIMNWIVSIVSLFNCFIVWKQKNKSFLLIIALIVYTILAIFLMLPYSRFIWDRVTLLQNFQFPWRFLAIPVFTTSVLGAFIVSSFYSKLKLYPLPFTLYPFIVLAILFFNKNYWHAQGYFYKPDSFFISIYNGTTDTGESSPIWSTRFMEHRYKDPLQVISGKASIQQIQRTTTKHQYAVSAAATAQLLENTVYFPGWEVLVDNVPVTIQYQDPHNRGLITFFIDSGRHTVQIVYKETKLRIIADLISLFSMLVIVALLLTRYVTKKSLISYTK